MPDGLNTYKSTLTPQEVDEAFRNIGNVQGNIEKAAGYAKTAEQYGTIVQQNQTAIQAIEDNLSDVQGAAQNAADAKNAAASASASASAASQSASDAEDAAKRAEDAAGVNPNDYYPKTEADQRFQMPIGYIFEWSPVSGQSIDLSTPQKVADYFGYGTWGEFAPGKVLAAKNANHAVGTSVGAESHVMTLPELVPHEHGINGWQIGTQDFGASTGLTTNAYPTTFNNFAPTTKTAGSGTAMSLMQPTQYVYRWQRMA